MSTEFAASTVFITGGGAGIGKATANLFLERGATVGILDLDTAGIPSGAHGYKGSVTEDQAVQDAIADFANRNGGRLDILVNNAGVAYYGTVEDGSLDDWRRIIDINLLSVVRTTRAALPFLRKSSHAAVVNIASALARTGLAKRALYSATKGAVEAMSRSMAADLVGESIRVNCVNPGTVDTAFVEGLARLASTDRATFAARQATGRMVTAQEVAHAIVYLARPGAYATVGSVLEVEAGFGSLRT